MMRPTNSSRIHFPDLDATRFLAFFLVFLYHVLNTKTGEIADSGFYHLLRPHIPIAHIGVNYFFTLSSFLISYLLLSEIKETKSVKIGYFLIRRILRIWPLYFSILLFPFVVLPKLYFFVDPNASITLPDLLPFLLFYSNFYIINHGVEFVFVLTILWTISVEEQFYLVWPFISKYGTKYFPAICWGLFIIAGLSPFFIRSDLAFFHSITYLSNFGIGGLAAYLVVENHSFLEQIKKLNRWKVFAIYFAVICLCLLYPYWTDSLVITSLSSSVLALFYAFVILEQSFSDHSILKLRKFRFGTYAGKLSYGLYVFQGLVLSALGFVGVSFFNNSSVGFYLVKPLLDFSFCLGIAHLSFKYLETPFLRLKSNYR